MEESKELTVVEQPQALITIEPKKYVELVFEPFAKQYADAVDAVREVAYDIKTTAGMATAIKHRAAFRDIRVASEKARKIRKAPILEIGKLLDSRQGEIESTLLPLETLFDEEIKAEEARKETEKAAKLAAEQQRIAKIRTVIDAMRNKSAEMVGKPSDEISAFADALSETPIALTEFFEFSGEAQVERDHAVKKLREMAAAQLAIEQAAIETARQAEVERLERERVAEENRVEAKRLADLAAKIEMQAQLARDRQALADKRAREQRETAEAEQRIANERAAAAMREQQEAHERRMAEQRAELQRQQAEINAAREEQEQIAREAREAAEAAAKFESEYAEALIENDRIDSERAAAIEQRRIADAEAAEARRKREELEADEAERIHRELIEFEKNGPGDVEIVRRLAGDYGVTVGDVMGWMKNFDYTATDEQLTAENVAANHMEKAA